MPRFNPEFKTPERQPEASFADVQKNIGVALLALDDARKSFEGVTRDLESFPAGESGREELAAVNERMLQKLQTEEEALEILLRQAQSV